MWWWRATKRPPKQKAYRHFADAPLGLQYRNGSSQAYEQKGGIYRVGNSVNVAGAKRIRDVYGDFKIPIKRTSHSERYQTLKQYLDAIPDELVGHSLGGSVSLQAQSNDHRDNCRLLHTTTYGAPVLSDGKFNDKTNRLRNAGDVISMFDKGAFANKQQIVKPPIGPFNYASRLDATNNALFHGAVPDI